jgi:hypothetical protein
MNLPNLDAYLNTIRQDYAQWMTLDGMSPVRERMIREFTVEVEPGTKYLKVITGNGDSRSVHSFICLTDMGKFTKGDVLKAAGWKAPARNFARANLFQADFSKVRWTGV